MSSDENDGVAIPQPAVHAEDIYAMHKYLLYFHNSDMEQKYFNFQYVDNAFIPGKIFAFAWGGIGFLSFFLFTDPISDGGAYMVESFTSLWWIGGYIHAILSVVLTVGLFIDNLRVYREIIYIAQVLIGWPGNILMLFLTKRPQGYSYSLIFGSYHSTMLIVQGRLHRCGLPIAFWPVVCILVATFSIPNYWDHHTKVEMLYCVVNLTPVIFLAFLERRTRQSFVEREKSTAIIAEIEHKTAVTQRMIANFFPHTPTKDLLCSSHGPYENIYPSAVLIVTDIAGFTAYTSKSNPPDVIDMLTEMFGLFDSTAQRYGVEKIATVGDSYCGAVFPNPNVSCAIRCSNAVFFSCSTFGFAGPGLQLRVGVHIGDVVGVFVGRAPPKFDLFGPGIEHARIMEEEGCPGHTHISHDVIDFIGRRHFLSFTPTGLGVVCNAFGRAMVYNNGTVDGESVECTDLALLRNTDTTCTLDSVKIVESLCLLMGVGDTTSGTYNMDPVVAPDVEDYDFSKFILTFHSYSVEKKFQKELIKSGIESFAAWVFLGEAAGLYIIQLNLQCSTGQDQAVASSILALLIGMCTYLQLCGTNHRFHAPITFIVYNCIVAVAFLAPTVECGAVDLQGEYMGIVAGCYECVALFSFQYCLSVKLTYRNAFAMLTLVVLVVCMAIRINTFHDDVAKVDPLPICGLSLTILSFFPEYSIRSAFRSKLQLQRLQADARSRGATMATSAMSIMLPTFVIEKIIALSREGSTKTDTHISETATQSSRHTHGLGDIDFNSVAATWEYPHAVLMFAKFHSDDPQFTPAVINMTVQAIEEIVKKFAVMKVKTIGSTIMLVTGIDDQRTRQEQVSGMVDAAIMIRACVFQEMDVNGLSYKIGVHCGPCFGAVIGGNGAIFDLFGDTVNTASRMCSTATAGSIQLSTPAYSMLLPRLSDIATRCLPISVKGKGVMEVFSL